MRQEEKLRADNTSLSLKRDVNSTLYDEVMQEFKRKSPLLQRKSTDPDENAAVTIQSFFKGYKIRKELDQMKAFHRNMSQPIVEEAGSQQRPTLLEKNQGQYLNEKPKTHDAKPSEPSNNIIEETDSNIRSWKRRQESYQAAINESRSPEIDVQLRETKNKRNKREDSYLQAIGSSLDVMSPQEVIEPKMPTKRQDSYQQAVGSLSPGVQVNEEGVNDASWKKRQDSYQKAIDSVSPRQVSPQTVESKTWKTRQESYQKAVEDMSPNGQEMEVQSRKEQYKAG